MRGSGPRDDGAERLSDRARPVAPRIVNGERRYAATTRKRNKCQLRPCRQLWSRSKLSQDLPRINWVGCWESHGERFTTGRQVQRSARPTKRSCGSSTPSSSRFPRVRLTSAGASFSIRPLGRACSSGSLTKPMVHSTFGSASPLRNDWGYKSRRGAGRRGRRVRRRSITLQRYLSRQPQPTRTAAHRLREGPVRQPLSDIHGPAPTNG